MTTFLLLLTIFFLPLAAKASSTGLVILGGSNARSSVELWSPGPQSLHCYLPSLSRISFGPTVNFVDDIVVACYGSQCHYLNGSHWLSLDFTLHQSRHYHKSAVVGGNILLTGGV